MYKVMLIDDEEIVIEGLNKMVKWHEMDCEIAGKAENGIEALQIVKSIKPDIIISDIRMPKLNGLEFISKVKEQKYDCQIIILTGHRDFDYAQEAVKLGVLRFLLKPTKIDELTETIRQAIEKIKEDREKAREYLLIKNKINKLNVSEKMNDEENKVNYIVYLAMKFIKKNYYKKLDLQIVADEIGVSSWHLSKLIKKEMGLSFIELLNQIKIEKAKELLITTNLKVYEIAEQVGYSDICYFSRMFKKIVGVTANKYRNNNYSKKI